MQTFLPEPSFLSSVRCLDNARLGKQRVECLQILNALEGKSSGWVNHPATKMWRGYENSLRWYLTHCINEWVKRGYKNTIPMPKLEDDPKAPGWVGDPKFHDSHKSNLLRKFPVWYCQFGWDVPDNLPYYWPVE